MGAMRIYFKNGLSLFVSTQVAKTIENSLIEGFGKFQSFSDENGNLILIINIEEIVYIEQ